MNLLLISCKAPWQQSCCSIITVSLSYASYPHYDHCPSNQIKVYASPLNILLLFQSSLLFNLPYFSMFVCKTCLGIIFWFSSDDTKRYVYQLLTNEPVKCNCYHSTIVPRVLLSPHMCSLLIIKFMSFMLNYIYWCLPSKSRRDRRYVYRYYLCS